MAFRFGDPGGRGYNAVGTSQVNLLAWWTGTNVTPSSFTIVASGSRTSGNSLRAGLGATSYISKTIDSQATWGIAFVIKTELMPASGTPIFTLLDSGTVQCDLRLNSDGSLSVTRNGTVLGTTTSVIPFGVWTHIEWKTKIDNSTGTTEVRINGASAGLSLSTQDTQNTSNASANTIAFGRYAGGGNVQAQFDDIIIYDGQANDPQGNPDINDFIGDCGLVWLLPTGAGTTTQFTPDSGSNYARVNEAIPDGNTSYVQDTVIGHIDTYAMTNMPSNFIGVKSLAVLTYAQKSDVSSKAFCAEIRTNSANFTGATSQALGNSYQYYFNNWGQNPSTTPATWSVSDVNAIEAGQKVLT